MISDAMMGQAGNSLDRMSNSPDEQIPKVAIEPFLQSRAADQTAPDDWCYVNNINDPDRPRALRLPAGKGREFCHDLDGLVEELKSEVPRAFESELSFDQYRANLGVVNIDREATLGGRIHNKRSKTSTTFAV